MSENKNELDIFSKIDNEMDQSAVINIMIAGFETNTKAEIESLTKIINDLEKKIVSTREDITKKFYDKQIQSVNTTFPFDENEYEFVLDTKSGFRYIKKGEVRTKTILVYRTTAKEKKYPNNYPSYFENVVEELPDFSPVEALEVELEDARQKRTFCKNEMINLTSRERQLRAAVSLQRLKDNEGFQEIMNNADVKRLISAPTKVGE